MSFDDLFDQRELLTALDAHTQENCFLFTANYIGRFCMMIYGAFTCLFSINFVCVVSNRVCCLRGGGRSRSMYSDDWIYLFIDFYTYGL